LCALDTDYIYALDETRGEMATVREALASRTEEICTSREEWQG